MDGRLVDGRGRGGGGGGGRGGGFRASRDGRTDVERPPWSYIV